MPKRRDDSGLTTLEWLLIVAAVAGLAALAVVLVTNVVGDTSEEISGQSARETGARVAALAVEEGAKNYDATADEFDSWGDWDVYFTNRCNRIVITFSDAFDDGATMTSNFASTTGAGALAIDAATVDWVGADETVADADTPQIQCEVP